MGSLIVLDTHGLHPLPIFSSIPVEQAEEDIIPSVGITRQSSLPYSRGMLFIPREGPEPHLELIINPLNIECVEESIAYMESNDWFVNVEIEITNMETIQNERIPYLQNIERFSFMTNESMDAIPGHAYDIIIHELFYQTFSTIIIENTGRTIIRNCFFIENYPGISFHFYRPGTTEKIVTVVYNAADYLVPIENNQCILNLISSSEEYFFGMNFFRKIGVHLMHDRVGICDPR
jgi:hypothetical protein